MRILPKILIGVLILAVLYGVLFLAERLTTQELTRIAHPTSQEAVCLMWRPRLLKGDGVCEVDLLNAQGKVVDTARLGTLDTAFNALQQYGQLSIQEQELTVANLRTGDLARRFVIRDGRLNPPN